MFDTAAAAENELTASGTTLLQDAEELTLEQLGENDFCFAIPFLLQTWFALVPSGCRAPEINFAALEKTSRPTCVSLNLASWLAPRTSCNPFC